MTAATRDATAFGPFGGGVTYYEGAGRIGILKFHVDMAAVKAYLGYTIDGSNGDIVEILNIPALTLIKKVAVKMITAEGTTCTMTIGDGSGAAGFLASFNINQITTNGATSVSTDAYFGGKVYLIADTLDLTFASDTDVAVAVFDVFVFCEFLDVPTAYSTSWT